MALLDHTEIVENFLSENTLTSNEVMYIFRANTDSLAALYKDSYLIETRGNPIYFRNPGGFDLCYVKSGEYRIEIHRSSERIFVTNNIKVFDQPPAYENLEALRASQRNAHGTGTVWTAGEFQFIEVDAATPDLDETTRTDGYHLITAGGVKLQYAPDGEVNVTALGDRGTDDVSLMIQRAAIAFPNHVIRIPAGNYSARTAASVGDVGNVQIKAHGTDITVRDDVPLIYFTPPSWEAIQSITPVNGDAYWGERKDITVTDGSAYNAGDLLVLASDDKQRCTRATPDDGTDYRRGWIAFVEEVAGNVVTLDRGVPWDLTTNPRIARMPRRRFTWEGGVVGYETGHSATWRDGQAFLLNGVSDILIDVEIEHTYAAAISCIGCFEPIVRVRGRELRNDEHNGQYGYLINDNSWFMQAQVVAGRNRHAYTTNQPLVAADSTQMHLYGATYGASVTGQSHGNTQGGFDTHHGSEQILFKNCVVSGGTDGGGQFVLRGVGHTLLNPRGFNGKDGIYVFTEAGVTNGVTECRIVNPSMEVDRFPFTLADDSVVLMTGGGYLRSQKFGACVKIQGQLSMRGVFDIYPGGNADIDYRRCFEIVDSDLDLRGATLLFDLQNIPASAQNYGLFQFDGTDQNTLRGGDIHTTADEHLTTAFYERSGSSATNTLGGCGMTLHTDNLGSSPSTAMGITGTAGIGFDKAWIWRCTAGTGGSNFLTRALTADDQTFPWYNRGDDLVFAQLSATANRIFGTMPAGTFLGQHMVLSVETTGGSTITLRNGAVYNLALGDADRVLANGENLTLTWNGAHWVASNG